MTISNKLIIVLLFLFSMQLSAKEQVSAQSLSLEGKAFQGVIRGKGFLGLFGVKGTLSFKNNNLVWQVGMEDDEYLPAPYQFKMEKGKLVFKATMQGKYNNDVVNWQGYFDGNQLSQVTAEWIREKGDVIHDSLLPDKVVMVFKPKAMTVLK